MLKPIKSEAQYDAALERIYDLMQLDLEPGTEGGDELEILSLLVKEYENINFPVPKPHPIEAIKFRLEQLNLSDQELTRILGSRSRKSEILSGERKLRACLNFSAGAKASKICFRQGKICSHNRGLWRKF